MDKLNGVLAVVKKQHFWLMCLLILVLALASWTMATGDLAARFKDRQGKLDGQLRTLESIVVKQDHPNEQFIESIKQRHNDLGNDVSKAWEYLYNEQRAKNQLPDVVLKLYPEFKDEFNKRWGPFEQMESLNNEMEDRYREGYRDQIKEHFPKLIKMIDRRYDPEVEPDGMVPEGGPKSEPTTTGRPGAVDAKPHKHLEGIVDWDDLGKALAHFQRWKGRPSTLDIMLAQEDLWVYEALLRVVRNTNNTGTDPNEYVKPANRKVAKIKRIVQMEIGQEAAQSWQKSDQMVVRMPAGGQAASDGRLGQSGAAAPPMTRHEGAAAAPTAAAGDKPGALAGRYVDDLGKPVPDPKQQPYAEFRMMPINLRVVIEQSAIPKLLAECVNSNMPIAVRTVRLLTSDPPPPPLQLAESSAGAGGESGGAVVIPGGIPRTPGGAGRPGAGHDLSGAAAGTPESRQQDEDGADPKCPPVTVEVQGIIYVYTPPDRSKLGSGTEGGQAPAASAPAGAPAPTPAAKPGPTPPAAGPAPATAPAAPPAGAAPAAKSGPPPVPAKPALPPATPAGKGGQP